MCISVHATDFFLYPLKTSEILWLIETEKDQWHEMCLNTLEQLLIFPSSLLTTVARNFDICEPPLLATADY